MVDAISQNIQRLIGATTPWLVVSAVCCVVLWIFSLCARSKTFSGLYERFNALVPFGKIVAIVLVCLCTMVGGSKERGTGTGGREVENGELRIENGESGGGPRSLPPALASVIQEVE